MNRPLRACALIAAIAAPAMLSAQSTDKPVSFGVSGGISLPLGEGSDDVNTGYNITGHLFFKPAALQSIRLRADVSFDRWDFDGIEGNTRALGFSGNAIYDFPAQSASIVRPYVIGGLGLYSSKSSIDVGALQGSTSDTNLGLQAGGGLSFQLSGFSTFAEAKFVNVFTEGGSTRFVPITFGVKF